MTMMTTLLSIYVLLTIAAEHKHTLNHSLSARFLLSFTHGLHQERDRAGPDPNRRNFVLLQIRKSILQKRFLATLISTRLVLFFCRFLPFTNDFRNQRIFIQLLLGRRERSLDERLSLDLRLSLRRRNFRL